MKFRSSLLIFILLLLVQEASAQMEASKRSRLKDVIGEALQNNQMLKASGHDVKAKEAQAEAVGTYENPTLMFEAMNYPSDTLNPREYGMTGRQISLSQKIPFPGKLTKLREAAFDEARSRKETLTSEELKLIRDVKEGFYKLYLSYRKKELLEEQRALLRQLIAVGRTRYSTGKLPQAELISLQVEEAELVDKQLEAEKDIQVFTGDLNHKLGRAEHRQFFRPEDIKLSSTQFEILQRNALAQEALSESPSLKAKRFQLSSAEAKQSFAKRGYLPDFELRAGYTMREPSPGDRGVSFVSAGIGITLPIWGKESDEVKAAASERLRAEAEFQEERIHLLHNLHTTLSELKEARKRVELLETGLIPLTKQAVVSGRSAYLAGRLEYSTLLEAIRKRYQTEYAYSEAITNFETKLADLEVLLGKSMRAQK